VGDEKGREGGRKKPRVKRRASGEKRGVSGEKRGGGRREGGLHS
jgi:hypothetical protein